MRRASRTNMNGRGTLAFALTALLWISLSGPAAADADRERVDMLVYGATPAGIAAARSAAQDGRQILVIEPTQRIGGLVTNGLSHPDFRTLEGVTGMYRDLIEQALAHYESEYGPDSPQARTTYHGTHAEPSVNLMIFERWLNEADGVRVLTEHHLTDVTTEAAGPRERITAARFVAPDGETRQFTADLFIDATYEGDLMAAAGVPYRVGREARDEYGEPLAPDQADDSVQGYNFRLIMTDDPDNRVMATKPDGYDREDYVDLLPYLEAGDLESVFARWSGCIYKRHEPALPNDKYDINDVSNSPYVRLSLPSINDEWPDGDRETRQRIFDEHVRHNVGMFYFLQNDKAVPESFQEEARQWGWPKDEFVDSDHLPVQLYVREARRMVGEHVYTQSDASYADPDADEARSTFHRDAIAMGDYGLNCHGTAHEGPRFGGEHTGEFYQAVPPYQVPYGVMVPKEQANLLVPVACSASHVGFSALRFEPVWTSMGQAAGVAAAVAMEKGVPVQDVPVAMIQQRLHTAGAATIYVSDVLRDSDDFAAVQWWGARGGLHNLEPRPDSLRGPHDDSQYHEAYPGHAARLNEPLTRDIREQWLDLARSLDLPTESLESAETRGDFIRKAFSLHRKHARQAATPLPQADIVVANGPADVHRKFCREMRPLIP